MPLDGTFQLFGLHLIDFCIRCIIRCIFDKFDCECYVRRNFLNVTLQSGTSVVYRVYGEPSPSPRLICRYKTNFVYGYEVPNPGFYIAEQTFLKGNEKPCPPGGNCTDGGLKPLPGYWGPLIENGAARFIKCVPEFCCTGTDCVDNSSCNAEMNRTGILCTQCIEGYSPSLFSPQCFPDDECEHYWILAVMAAFIILIVALAVNGDLPYFLRYYGLLTLISKGISEIRYRRYNVGHTVTQRGHGTDGGDVTEVGGIQGSKIKSTFILCVILIFYYSQDVLLYHIDVEPYSFPFLDKIKNSKLIYKIYKLNAYISKQIAKYSCLCDISPIGKLMINTSTYPLICLTFGIIYVAPFCIFIKNDSIRGVYNWIQAKITGEKWYKIRKNIQFGFVLVAMIGYQKLTITALRLVNCVDVHESVLLMDSNTKCSQTGPVWIYIVLCSIHLPIYLMIVPKRLEMKTICIWAFNFGLVFPGFYLIYWGLECIWNKIYVRTSRHRPAQGSEMQPWFGNPGNQRRRQQRQQFNSLRGEVTLGEVIIETTPIEQTHKLQEELCDNLQGDYKVYRNGWLNWAGIVLLLRMLLVIFSVFIRDPLIRTSAMFAVSVINLILLASFRPYKKLSMNVMAILCQVAIMVVGICYLILAKLLRNQSQAVEDDPIIQNLKIVIYVFSVIIPGVCVIIVLLDNLVVQFVIVIILLLLYIFGEEQLISWFS